MKSPDTPLLIYCDNAATTLTPQPVIDALVQYYTHEHAPIHRGIYARAEYATERYEQARATVARFIGACSDEIVFTSGATQAINMVARGWGDKHVMAGDEIIVSALEHHANVVPWQELARRKNAVLRVIPLTGEGKLDMQAYRALLSFKTKIVAVTHVSNVLGTRVDVQTIALMAHAVGAKVLIDACQSVPHERIDVSSLGADFLVFSGHKLYGPTGIGVLWISRDLHDAIEPVVYGGGMVYSVGAHAASWVRGLRKLEAGSPPAAQAVGLAAAIDYLEKTVDFALLRIQEAALCMQLIEGLQRIPGIQVLGPIEELKKNGHLVSFVVDGMHAHDVAAYLDMHGIAVRAGHHCAQPLHQMLGIQASIRVSFYAHNTAQEVAYLLACLTRLKKDEA